MIVKYIDGNIVKLFLEGNHVAHGCNCFHLMGAGVAGQLAKAYPPILEVDKSDTFLGDTEKLGNYTKAVGKKGQFCFNLYTQFDPGRNLDYGALANSMINLNKWAEHLLVPPTVYMPRIGCGIAGGDWEKVKTLINIFTDNVRIIIVDWDGE